ncbi:MAG TPA: HNH endonuclease [Acidimicrobiales bacterium]
MMATTRNPTKTAPKAKTRSCGLCKRRPAVGTRGVPRCTKCNPPNGTTMHRTCRICGRKFTTKNRSRRCGPCTQRDRKHACADCGTPIDPRSALCMPCWGKAHRGEKAPSWKGGRIRHRQHGYVLVRVPWHPRINTRGYVREHILVMEEALGRYLEPDETVHHRNGVRDDNRIENLELWVKAHPSGQRAAELLQWAEAIVARYGPVREQLGSAVEAA